VNRLRGENNEGVLVALILVVVLVMGIVEPNFLSSQTLVNTIRSGLVDLTLALGVLVVMISGGIDVSFTAIAIFSGYATVMLMTENGLDGTLWPFLVAAVIGVGLGSLNAAMVGGFRLPTLIVTLGTGGIIRGALIAFIGSATVNVLPSGLESLARARIISVDGAQLSTLVVPVAALCVIVALLLRSTMLGRSVYAVGGETESARRIGVRVGRTQTFVYLFAGLLAGVGGLMHVVLSRQASPYDLVGSELDVIAAVVIGGASIFGGRGSVLGTVLGVGLIAVIDNSLVQLGVPGAWQRLVVGLLVLVGVSTQVLGRRRQRGTPILEEAVR
jgi:simple sugar transport system permease protein